HPPTGICWRDGLSSGGYQPLGSLMPKPPALLVSVPGTPFHPSSSPTEGPQACAPAPPRPSSSRCARQYPAPTLAAAPSPAAGARAISYLPPPATSAPA